MTETAQKAVANIERLLLHETHRAVAFAPNNKREALYRCVLIRPYAGDDEMEEENKGVMQC